MANATPNSHVILYVPGIKPKPPAAEHRAALWRCLLEGVRRSDAATAADLAAHDDAFHLVSWSHAFYQEHRNLAVDEPGIERLLRLAGPEPADAAEAAAWPRRLLQRLYLLSDAFPLLMPLVAQGEMRVTLRDTERYFRNEGGVAVRVRRVVADALIEAWRSGARVLVVGHSLGSVIAWDVLWELSWRFNLPYKVDLFVSVGSPLGLHFVRDRLLGAREAGARRYPTNIRRWHNLAAIGETTALERPLAQIYAPVKKLGLVSEISDDLTLRTWFRGPDGLNVHKCYGYLVNPVVAGTVAAWWREAAATRG